MMGGRTSSTLAMVLQVLPAGRAGQPPLPAAPSAVPGVLSGAPLSGAPLS